MRFFAKLTAGLRAMKNPKRVEREMDDELTGFLNASIEAKRRAGMTDEQAARAARVEMGSTNSVKHRIRSAGWESTAESIGQDLRYSVRLLAKSPVFTLVAIVSLALGIGANTAIFTLIDQVLLSQLPVRDPQQLVSFDKSDGGGVLGGIDLGSYGMFPWSFARQLAANPGPFQGVASYGSFSITTSIRLPAADGAPSNTAAMLVPASLVSGNYFSLLGVNPLMGRTIMQSDDTTPGSGAVVVLSQHFWQHSLSSSPAVVGKTITVNGAPFEVIGVMPENFHGLRTDLEPPDLWTPTSMQPVIMQQPSFLTPDGPYFLHLFGRLNPALGKTAQAESQTWLDQQVRTNVLASEGKAVTPARQAEIGRITIPLFSAAYGVSPVRNQFGDSLKILMVVVSLVLLIACANLANFLLARAASRQREIATRLALGSSRARIMRQSLTETLVLSLAGGLLGLGIAFAATRALIAFVSRGAANVSMKATPDLPVLLFTLGVSLLTGIIFGLAPALAAARTSAAGAMSANTRTRQGAESRQARFWPKALVTAQVMLSVLLLVGAGLFLRTLRNLQNQDFGFERTHLLLGEINERLAGLKPSQVGGVHQQLLERLSAIPGVRSAALSLTPPIGSGNWSSTIKLSGYTPAPKENMSSLLNRVSGKYFETAAISIVSGRAIGDADTGKSLKVAVVNETVAKHFFPRGDALGRMLTIDIDTVKGPWQIVGIARDTHSGDPRLTEPSRMTYIPLAQIEAFNPVDPDSAKDKSGPAGPPEENQDRFAAVILLRTTADPAKTTAALRAAVAAVDPNLPVEHVETITEQVSRLITRDQMISSLTAIFSILALLLAAIGLYGVMSYSVVRRTNEIGIRIALGAESSSVLWMVLRESLWLLGIGLALGLPLSLGSLRLMQSQLYGLSASDPATIAASVLIIAAVTVFAAWLPARRATRVDPLVALRCD
jgi:predicted permease